MCSFSLYVSFYSNTSNKESQWKHARFRKIAIHFLFIQRVKRQFKEEEETSQMANCRRKKYLSASSKILTLSV